MRPIRIVGEQPKRHATEGPPPGTQYTWTVRDRDGEQMDVNVFITRGARDWTADPPVPDRKKVFATIGEGVADAVQSDGRSIVLRHVIGVDDPCRDWRVHGEGIFPPDQPAGPEHAQ
jgi:hypothetical protein